MARNIEKVAVATKGNLDIIPIPIPLFPKLPADRKVAAPLVYNLVLQKSRVFFTGQTIPAVRPGQTWRDPTEIRHGPGLTQALFATTSASPHYLPDTFNYPVQISLFSSGGIPPPGPGEEARAVYRSTSPQPILLQVLLRDLFSSREDMKMEGALRLSELGTVDPKGPHYFFHRPHGEGQDIP